MLSLNQMQPISIQSLLVAAIAMCGAFARGEATIEGRVTVSKQQTAPVMNKRYDVVTKAGTIATDPLLCVVYLEGKFPAPAKQPQAEMGQKGLRFLTPLLPVQTGTKVEFPNHDDTFHNVFSYSKPKRFDLGRYRSDERPIPSQVFDHPGLVVLNCEIHEHMRAVILVLDTPHFTKTAMDGRYKLSELPAGKYTLRVWVDSKTTLSKPVELKDGGTLRVDFP